LNYRLRISVPTLQVSQKKGKSQQPNTGIERSHFHKEAVIIKPEKITAERTAEPRPGIAPSFFVKIWQSLHWLPVLGQHMSDTDPLSTHNILFNNLHQLHKCNEQNQEEGYLILATCANADTGVSCSLISK
jgi:hypothetical protein